MLSESAAALLILRFQPALAVIAARTAASLASSWDRLPSYDEMDVVTFTARTAPVVRGAKVAAVGTAVGFYATLTGVRPPSIRARDIDVEPDMRAGFLSYWHALKEGRPYLEAVAAGRSSTEAEADRFVTSTSRRTGDAVIEATGQRVVGWRRTLDSKACDWCQVVSTQRYKTAESADFGHARCGCTPVPIIGDRDPGRVVNRELLKELKARGAVDEVTRLNRAKRERKRTQVHPPDTGEP